MNHLIVPSEALLAAEDAGSDSAASNLPCSFSQERFWVLAQLDPGNAALNVGLRWELTGPLDPLMLERAIRSVVARHEILRTSFPERDGQPIQLVAERVAVSLPVIELGTLPEPGRSAELLRVGKAEARVPFDLRIAPLIRFKLVRLQASLSVLLVTAHHMVFDGWSIGVLANDLGRTYAAMRDGAEADLPELAIQYVDYALWQREWWRSHALDRLRQYWTDQLDGFRYVEIAPDRPRPSVQTYNGDIVSTLLARELTGAAEALAHENQATLFMVALTGLAAVLHRHTGETDLTIGTQVAGRDQVELEHVIGPFINTLVLRLDLSAGPTLATLLRRVRDTTREALEHREMPFEWLIRLLNPRRDLSRNPLFSVNLIVQRAFAQDRACGDVELRGLPSHSPGALYDLNFVLVERAEGWRASCEYNSDLFSENSATQILGSWKEAIAEFVRDADTPLESLRLTKIRSETERRLLAIWEHILALPAIGPDENFFELGGYSLLAARMLAAVEAEFGVRPLLADLYRAPTVRGLAAALERPTESTVDFAVQVLQPAGEGAPVIAINNFGVFHTLARQLGTSQPFISVYLADPDRSRPLRHGTLEEIAADYIQVLRTLRPHGPYNLLGWCVSGKIAIEVARQLHEAGEQVPLVIMIDTWAPGHRKRLSRLQAFLAAASYRLQWHYTQWRQGRRTPLRMLLSSRYARPLKPLANRFGVIQEDQYEWFIKSLDSRIAHYKPRPYHGRVLLIRSSDEPAGWFLDPQFGWGGVVTGPITVRESPGSHLDIFKLPHVGSLATCVADALQELRPADRPG